MLAETKALEEVETELRKVETTIMKKRFSKKFDEEETLKRLKTTIEIE